MRVAEVSRSITRELGFNWQVLGTIGRFSFGLLTGAFAGANLIPGLGGEVGRNFIGAGYSSTSFDINGLIDALAQDQLISILAEPNLTAQSGETASFSPAASSRFRSPPRTIASRSSSSSSASRSPSCRPFWTQGGSA